MNKLFDSERKIMEVLWEEGDLPASKIAAILKERVGWNRNTTYTVIGKCIDKGAVSRTDPKFICHAELSKSEVQKYETQELIDRMFDGSGYAFLSAFLEGDGLSREEVQKLRKLIDDME